MNLSFHCLHFFSSDFPYSFAVPSQYTGGVRIINYVGNELDTRPTKRVREEEPLYMQQKLGMSPSTNHYQGKPDHIRTLSNLHDLSPGLGLSNMKVDCSSSISSTCENLKYAPPGVLSLDDTVKTEIDRQMEELARYIKLQVYSMLYFAIKCSDGFGQRFISVSYDLKYATFLSRKRTL